MPGTGDAGRGTKKVLGEVEFSSPGWRAFGWCRGWPFTWDQSRRCFVWADTDEPVDFRVDYGYRECFGCGRPPTEDGHDACVADLPGVSFACCGHGRPELGSVPYVTFHDGSYLRGVAALEWFRQQGREVPDDATVVDDGMPT